MTPAEIIAIVGIVQSAIAAGSKLAADIGRTLAGSPEVPEQHRVELRAAVDRMLADTARLKREAQMELGLGADSGNA